MGGHRAGRTTWASGAGLFAFGRSLALKVIGHAKSRVQGWLDPWPHASTTGYQIIQGWFAIAAGGLFGEGPGQSSASHIPEASTDLIFAVIADELGLVGASALLIGVPAHGGHRPADRRSAATGRSRSCWPPGCR